MGLLPSERERKYITLSRAEASEHHGKAPEDRTLEEHLARGFVNVDKPQGPTSHEVVAWVKKILGLGKAGHGGTLDPRVSGILPVALEDSTKVLGALLSSGKEYIAVMKLHGSTSRENVEAVFEEFTGEIIQRPPVKSSVKRQLRKREIYYIELLELEEDMALFRVGCEAGTYIRKLCHDMGLVMGVGAHMLELRRTKSGNLTERSLVTLHDLKDAYVFWKEEGRESFLRKAIVPVEEVVSFLPGIVVRDSAVDALCHGAPLALPGVVRVDSRLEEGETVAIFTLKGELVAVGMSKMNTRSIVEGEKGIAAKTDRVLMSPGTYPRRWKGKKT